MASIKSFYAATNVFVTGGTGFMGKVLVEKLIRSCPDLGSVSLLIRPKKGLTPQQRLHDFRNDQIFNRVRSECPGALSKLRVFSGDMCSPRLGLSHVDEETLLEEVSVAFHLAASIRFDEGMSDAAEQNTLATLKMMDLCSRMPHLKSMVHVSTAYCNPAPEVVEEKVYEASNILSKDSFLALAQTLPKPILDTVGEQILGQHSNTYTYTKSVSEEVVAQHRGKFPLCIVRPSIVTAALREPYPGWVDSYDGLTNMIFYTATGSMRTTMCRDEELVDMIPVDITSNAVIAAAWANHESYKAGDSVPVINCASGEINPITWGEQRKLTMKWSRKTPFPNAKAYPNVVYRRDRRINGFFRFLHHSLPAAVADGVGAISGQRPRNLKLAKGIHNFMNRAEWVMMEQWRFKSDQMRQLVEKVRTAEDGQEFDCDFSQMNWSEYMRDYLMGIRKYLLRREEESAEEAKRRATRLYLSHVGYQVSVALAGSLFLYGIAFY